MKLFPEKHQWNLKIYHALQKKFLKKYVSKLIFTQGLCDFKQINGEETVLLIINSESENKLVAKIN